MDRTSVLLVDDDIGLQRAISGYLDGYGYRVEVSADGREMDAVLRRERPDLIILDLMLPGEDGLSICRRLSAGDYPPVIMASASGEETDRVLGLELGADDYLTKPFSPRELLARIRAVLRRRDSPEPGHQRGEKFHFADFSFDPVLRTLRAPSGAVVPLSNGEASILALLLVRRGQLVTRQCAEHLAADDEAPGPGQGRALDILVSRLRRKLARHSDIGVITTVRGRGYGIGCPVTRG